MRRKGLWLGVLATAMVVGNASAATIDGNYATDWFTYAGGNTALDDWDQGLAVSTRVDSSIGWANDEEGATPGSNLQNYDVEQMFYQGVGNTLYIGLVTGFGPAGEVGGGAPNLPFFHAGDLFIGAGNAGTYLIGVALGTDVAGRQGDTWVATDANLDATSVYFDGTPAPDFTASDPYRVAGTNALFLDDYAQVAAVKHGAHWFYEIALNVDQSFYANGINLHWTMECGNDAMNAVDTHFTPKDPVVPVPAAAPLAMLGMAIVGLARRKRQNKN